MLGKGGKYRVRTIAAAYHEAGHRAASLLLGVGIKPTHIVPHLERNGSYAANVVSYFSREPGPQGRERFTQRDYPSLKLCRRIEKNIKICFAGRLAEHRLLRSRATACAKSDDLIIVYYLFLLNKHRNQLNLRFQQLHLQVEDLLDFGWTLVEAIAHRLLTSSYLTNAELKAIYSEQFRYVPSTKV